MKMEPRRSNNVLMVVGAMGPSIVAKITLHYKPTVVGTAVGVTDVAVAANLVILMVHNETNHHHFPFKLIIKLFSCLISEGFSSASLSVGLY